MSPIDFTKKSLIFITGASRGIGRTLSIEIGKQSNPDTIFVLIATTVTALEETKLIINQFNESVNVLTYPFDLSKPTTESYEQIFDEILKNIDVTDLINSIFIHNAASIGILKKLTDINDVDSWKNYYDFNVISPIILNNYFIKKFKGISEKLSIINISSSNSQEAYVNMAMYGSGKAARESIFKVLALEEPKIKILNYWPGPVDTEMFKETYDKAQSEILKEELRVMRNSLMMQPEETVRVLIDILIKGDYKSGDTVRYYDRN